MRFPVGRIAIGCDVQHWRGMAGRASIALSLSPTFFAHTAFLAFTSLHRAIGCAISPTGRYAIPKAVQKRDTVSQLSGYLRWGIFVASPLAGIDCWRYSSLKDH